MYLIIGAYNTKIEPKFLSPNMQQLASQKCVHKF